MSYTCARGSFSGNRSQYRSSPSSTPSRVASASRMSVSDFSQVTDSDASSSTSTVNPSSSSSGGSPASSSVSMMSPAPRALWSRRVPSVNLRNSPAASTSSGYAVGNSRASTGSSGSVVGPEKSNISSRGSSPLFGAAVSLRRSSTSCDARDLSRSASNPLNVATAPPPPPLLRPAPESRRSSVLLPHRGPKAVLVHPLHVALHLLARPVGDN